jgi:hypothetical protein
MIRTISTKYYFIFLSLLLLFSFANKTLAASPDAIAIRILPNPEHHSAMRWYREQGFQGSPQALIVDGYEAVRDGRTVYVDAGNVDVNNNALYTNIYLISYNQNAEASTLDIFGSLLSHWKFNTNTPSPGTCSASTTISCINDTDCLPSEYCTSQKANIVRDVNRLSDLADIKLALTNYYAKNRRYPLLKAGSYLSANTISTWPSWQKVLAQDLAYNLPIDPINKLGICAANFNPITCWDESAKRFAGDVIASGLELPAGSHVYVYSTNANGTSYNLCAVMDSGYVNGLDNGTCGGSAMTGNSTNHPPVFTNVRLPNGSVGKPYYGYIAASDEDGDSLTWTTTPNPLVGALTGWSADSAMRAVPSNPYQKEIFSSSAGPVGPYSFTIELNDGRGGAISRQFTINVVDTPPTIAITIPTSNPTYISSTNPIALGGVATDDIGVTQVAWVNNRGGHDTANGTTAWTIPAITLLSGENRITVTATDTFGQTATDVITITYNAPVVVATDCTATGWAWSKNYGWISLNGRNCGTCTGSSCTSDGTHAGCPTVNTTYPNYSVAIDNTNGNISGYAWSQNLGWISFERSTAGNPPGLPIDDPGAGTGPIAKVNWNTVPYAVTGWAKALSSGNDGWIKFYGVTISNASVFSGQAWGGFDTDSDNEADVGIDWINFDHANYSCQTPTTQTCTANCSAAPGCRTSLLNGVSVAGSTCCGAGESCYVCNASTGYSWDSVSLTCILNCNDDCNSEGYECGFQTICGAQTDCGLCTVAGESCNGSGQCVPSSTCTQTSTWTQTTSCNVTCGGGNLGLRCDTTCGATCTAGTNVFANGDIAYFGAACNTQACTCATCIFDSNPASTFDNCCFGN